ncbi:MAG: SMI1/KNR4 family protein [Bacteroidales bacterium]|nr:SMI1/KNR4 family protein [Bacteroidales bacterium]
MKITWIHATPISDKLISEVENNYNVQLPNDLKTILKEGNNGVPSKRYFDSEVAKGHEWKTLLSYYKSDVENIHSVLSVLKDVDVNLFPFGDDPAGNMICLKENKVVLWHHETDEIEFVANSISEFLTKLY